MKTGIAGAAAFFLIAAAPAPAPDWLAGAWSETKGEAWTEEFWSPMRGGIMMGAGRTGQGAALMNWETMRIERVKDGSFVFWASPRGVKATPFPSTAVTSSSVVFTNPTNDYPQRIRYWREGKLLNAEIAMADGSKAQRWTFAPVGR